MKTETEVNTELNNANFSELKRYIRSGKYQEIDKWFEENKVSGNLELEKNVVEKIKPLFFNPNNSIHKRRLKKYLNDEKIRKENINEREISILKNLSFENQLRFLSVLEKNNINPDYFKVLKLTPENKKAIRSNENIITIITEKFITENFAEIDKIQEILGFNIMEQKTNIARFYFEFKNKPPYTLKGLRDLKITKPIFSPKCGIIFAYSEEKRKFLEERNIALPTIEETNILYHEMKKALHNNEFFTLLLSTKLGSNIEKKLDQLFKNYETIKLNLDETIKFNIDLENELQIKNNLKRKAKI